MLIALTCSLCLDPAAPRDFVVEQQTTSSFVISWTQDGVIDDCSATVDGYPNVVVNCDHTSAQVSINGLPTPGLTYSVTVSVNSGTLSNSSSTSAQTCKVI